MSEIIDQLERDGWRRMTRYDSARRRALWVRISPDGSHVEFRSGEDGQGAYASLTVGDDGPEALQRVVNVLVRAQSDLTSEVST